MGPASGATTVTAPVIGWCQKPLIGGVLTPNDTIRVPPPPQIKDNGLLAEAFLGRHERGIHVVSGPTGAGVRQGYGARAAAAMRASRADVWRAGVAWSNGPAQCRPNSGGRDWGGSGWGGSDCGGAFRAWSHTELALAIFFFQAEDGIRDLYVTGVQTCALPIFAPGDKVKTDRRDARRLVR